MAIVKATDGWVEQEFDENGKCVWQKFVAGDGCDYYEGDTILDHDDPRINLYHPFEMVNPQDDLIPRIVKWNEDRQNLNFNHSLETKMLAEELFEFCGYERYAAKSLAEIFQNEHSKMATRCEVSLDLKPSSEGYMILNAHMKENLAYKSDLADAAGDLVFIAIGTIKKLGFDPHEVLKRICDHNDAKGSKKDADGKIVKDETFVEPVHD